MAKVFSVGFWATVARIVLRNRIAILILIALATAALATQFQYMRFTYTEANLLPDDHEINLEYFDFLDKFGEEGNLVVIAVQDSSFFTPEKFNNWNKLSDTLQNNKHVDLVVGLNNIQKLSRNDQKNAFDVAPLFNKDLKTQEELDNLKKHLYYDLPFYNKFLYNVESNTFRTAIYINKEIVNKPARKELIEQFIIPVIDGFERENKLDVRVSGMPYIRTLNSQTIISEIAYFIGAAMLVTGIIFFFLL